MIEKNEKINIILDCDPGHDDAIAIMVAGLSNKFNLKGITVVAGNQTYDKVTKNALRICEYLDINVPVYGGMDKPLVREQIIAKDFHGDSGLDGIKIPDTTRMLEKQHAVDFLIETVMKNDEKIVFVPVGPLTNIATAIKKEPAIINKLDKIVLMGGSYNQGNATKYAEFNVYADPEAANIVFSSGIPIYMMGLDITNLTVSNKKIVEKIKEYNTKASKVLYEGLHFPKKYDDKGNFIYHTLHDVVTLAYLIDNSVVKLEKIACKVELEDSIRYGKTICSNSSNNDDKYKGYFTEEQIKNSKIYTGVKIDLEKFWNILFEIVEK